MEELIEKYLLGQLSKDERIDFEQRIKTDSQLAKEVAIQRDLMEAIKLQGLKTEISNAYQRLRLGKKIKTAVITTLIAAVVGLGIYYISKSLQHHKKADKIEATLPINDYEIDNSRDTVIETALKSSRKDSTKSRSTSSKNENKYEVKFQDSNSIKPNVDGLSVKQLDSVIEVYLKNEKQDTVVLGNGKMRWITTYEKQTQLFSYLKSDYPNLYANISSDFNLDDPTFHASFKVTYCNFKKTPMLTASNSAEAKEYEVDMSDKMIKSREMKKFFELCAADGAH